MEQTPSTSQVSSEQTIIIGRYALHREIARGGMATIHFGRLLGDEGFSRIVAVKRLHAELAQDEQFMGMFLDEARIASRVQHRNVVPVLDVAAVGQEVILVQEYVHGAPLDLLLANLRRSEQTLAIDLAVAIACQVLAGLQATHDTVDELGQPMHIVHRDVSPQNVMVALDGSVRLLDFGIATSGAAAQAASEPVFKGKFSYSAPEHLQRAATAQSDIYSASVLLWELLVGERMHGSKKGPELVSAVLRGELPGMCETLVANGRWQTLNEWQRTQLEALEPVVQKGLCLRTSERWRSAREMEEALAAQVAPASDRSIAEWLRSTGQGFLAHRNRILSAEEQSWRRLHPQDSGRASDPGSQVALRSMRSSHPGESSAPAAGADMNESRRARRALAAVCVVALACGALALLSTSSPRPTAAVLRDAPQRAQGSSAAQVAPRPAHVAPSSAPPTAIAPLAPPTRASVQPPAQPGTAEAAKVEPGQVVPARVLTGFRPLPAAAKAVAAPVVAPAGQARDDSCDVPYYFEGAKKIFKSSCI